MRKLNKSELKRVYGGLHRGIGSNDNGSGDGYLDSEQVGWSNEPGATGNTFAGLSGDVS